MSFALAFFACLHVAASIALAQAVPGELTRLAGRARVVGPFSVWCRAEFRPGHSGAFAVSVAAAGGGQYIALDSDGTATTLASFTGSADLACYSRAEAEKLDFSINTSDTITGRIAPRWDTTVVCGFTDDTTAQCWQYSPEDRTFVPVGQWATYDRAHVTPARTGQLAPRELLRHRLRGPAVGAVPALGNLAAALT